MRFLHWNIRHGGGNRRQSIVEAIVAHRPDVVTLVEHRPKTGKLLREALVGAGFPHQIEASSSISPNGVLICSREDIPFTPLPAMRGTAAIAGVRFVNADLVLIGTYIPAKQPYPEWMRPAFVELATVLATHRHSAAMLLADLNTGIARLDADIHASFTCEDQFAGLCGIGWTDAVRHVRGEERMYSFRIKNQFRIDHAFVTELLIERVTAATYSDGELAAGLSDHKPLVIELRE